MVYFKQTVLGRIKMAASEEELVGVIHQSIDRLKGSNVHGHIIQRFVVSMSMTLDKARVDATSRKEEQNMNLAIGLFRKLQKPGL